MSILQTLKSCLGLNPTHEQGINARDARSLVKYGDTKSDDYHWNLLLTRILSEIKDKSTYNSRFYYTAITPKNEDFIEPLIEELTKRNFTVEIYSSTKNMNTRILVIEW